MISSDKGAVQAKHLRVIEDENWPAKATTTWKEFRKELESQRATNQSMGSE